MTAVLSASPSPTSSPHHTQSPPPNPSVTTLPPLNTNPNTRRSPLPGPPSYAKSRISTYSITSNAQNRSRPQSYAFPHFHSSLPYALVRDFAYPFTHPNHYGPPPESSVQSGSSTPQSESQRRLSDPPNATWEGANPQWQAGPWGGDGFLSNQQLPQTAYKDGPPYSEDEDLHSPVVVSSRHKKYKSGFAALGVEGKTRGRSRGAVEDDDMEEGEYFSDANRPGAELSTGANRSTNGREVDTVTYPLGKARQSLLAPNRYHAPGQRDSHFAATLPSRSYNQEEDEDDSYEDLAKPPNADESRYSRDYQFTIASPDEEMHGKAVALFDFARENENELPLVEGQVIWVSYRHGQGWLVAEDPKTRESGLVPEEYVRLLRDIEGGWTSLSGELNEEAGPSEDPLSPVSAAPEHVAASSQPEQSNGIQEKEKRPPIVSTFSTSSKDLSPYPHKLQSGQAPPPVMHYGSQTNTPTHTSAPSGPLKRTSSEGGRSRSPEQAKNQRMTTHDEDTEDSDDDER